MPGMIESLVDLLLAATNPSYRRYRRAKRLHEGSPTQLLPDGFYTLLTEADKEAARNDAQLNQAAALYLECAREQSTARNPLNEGITYCQIGLVRLRQGKSGEAQRVLERALALLSQLPDRSALVGCSTCYFYLAQLALERGDLPSAIEYIRKSRAIDEGLGDSLGVRLNDELLAQARESTRDTRRASAE